MHAFSLDLRFALRRLASRPAFALLAVATLAVGIGATSILFSVVKGVLLDPLPFPESDRLARLYATHLEQGVREAGLAEADFRDLEERVDSLETIAEVGAWSWFGLDYGRERPRNLTALRVTPGFLDLLGVRPLDGRLFLEGEDRPGSDKLAILSWTFWQEELGGDPTIVGGTVTLDREPWTVVGVMPRSFAYPHPGQMVWIPWTRNPDEPPSRRGRWVNTVARLADGASVEAARTELSVFANGLAEEHPATNEGWNLTVVSLKEATVGFVEESLWSLHAGVLILLLVAVTNVAGLGLIHGLARRSELAIRNALGAGRSGTIRLLLVESLILTLGGGALGLLLAVWGLEALVAANPDSLPRVEEVGLDPGVLLGTLLVSVVVGVAVGLFPAVQAIRDDVVAGLGDASRSPTSSRAASRVRHGLVVGELALSMILLVGAGLLGRSFFESLRTDLGFDAERTAAVQLFAWDGAYSEPVRRLAFFDRLAASLLALPEVEAVGGVSALPFSDLSGGQVAVHVAGRAEPERVQAGLRIVTPGFFEAMSVPLLRGRNFQSTDHGEAPFVAIVTRTAADRYFGGGDEALGQSFSLGGEESWEVVGIADDFLVKEIESPPRPEILLHHPQNPTGTMTFVLRTDRDPAQLVGAARATVWENDLQQSIFAAFPVADVVRNATEHRRILAGVAVAFAGTAIFMAVVGLYGALAYSVRSRRRELGIRISVGARSEDLVRLVLGQGLRLVGIGVAVGAVGAAAVGFWLSGQLYGVGPGDPWTWIVGFAVAAATGIAASTVPAWRAARVDPVESLREG